MRRWKLLYWILLLGIPLLAWGDVEISQAPGLVPAITAAGLPASAAVGQHYTVTDALSDASCQEGGGETVLVCWWDGTSWVPDSAGESTGTLTETDTLDTVFNRGKDITGANSLANSMSIGSGSVRTCIYTSGANESIISACDAAKTTEYTSDVRIRSSGDLGLRNQDDDVCGSFSKSTGAWTPTTTGTCAPNLRLTDTVQTVTGAGLKTPNVRTSSPYTMLSSDCGGTIVNNVAAAGSLEVDLLADMTGCTVCFWSKGGGAILADPNSTDTILSAISPALSGGDRYQQAAQVGAGFCVEGLSATEILAWPGNGTYSDAD